MAKRKKKVRTIKGVFIESLPSIKFQQDFPTIQQGEYIH